MFLIIILQIGGHQLYHAQIVHGDNNDKDMLTKIDKMQKRLAAVGFGFQLIKGGGRAAWPTPQIAHLAGLLKYE